MMETIQTTTGTYLVDSARKGRPTIKLYATAAGVKAAGRRLGHCVVEPERDPATGKWRMRFLVSVGVPC